MLLISVLHNNNKNVEKDTIILRSENNEHLDSF